MVLMNILPAVFPGMPDKEHAANNDIQYFPDGYIPNVAQFL